MTTSPRFWNWMAGRYSRQPIADQAAYLQKLAKTRSYLGPAMEVLEFGCGTGSTALVHAPHVSRIDAIDYSARMIDIARTKAKAQNIDNVTFTVATIEDWPAEDHSYDAILGLSILHLLEDKEAVLRKVHRLLRRGGVFVSSTICLTGTKRIERWLLSVGHALGVLPLLRAFGEADLVASLEGAGFAIEHQWRAPGGSAVFIIARAARQG